MAVLGVDRGQEIRRGGGLCRVPAFEHVGRQVAAAGEQRIFDFLFRIPGEEGRERLPQVSFATRSNC